MYYSFNVYNFALKEPKCTNQENTSLYSQYIVTSKMFICGMNINFRRNILKFCTPPNFFKIILGFLLSHSRVRNHCEKTCTLTSWLQFSNQTFPLSENGGEVSPQCQQASQWGYSRVTVLNLWREDSDHIPYRGLQDLSFYTRVHQTCQCWWEGSYAGHVARHAPHLPGKSTLFPCHQTCILPSSQFRLADQVH